MNFSQGTYVAGRETRPPPSAQDGKTTSIDGPEDNHGQILADEVSNNTLPNGSNIHGKELSFPDVLKQYQESLNHDFDDYEQNIDEMNPAQAGIADFDWEQLELDYQRDVGEAAMKEKEIMSQFDARFKVFKYIDVEGFTDFHSNSCSGCRFRTNAKANEHSRGAKDRTFPSVTC